MDRKSKLQEVFEQVSPSVGEALREHLLGGTSANWLSETLTKTGHPVSPTSIKRERAKMRKEGGQ